MAHPGSTPAEAAIPGWRVILSDRGRLWASRVTPFTEAQLGLGAERTVDADTLDKLRAEVDRQETAAGRVRGEASAGQATAQATGQAAVQIVGQTAGQAADQGAGRTPARPGGQAIL